MLVFFLSPKLDDSVCFTKRLTTCSSIRLTFQGNGGVRVGILNDREGYMKQIQLRVINQKA